MVELFSGAGGIALNILNIFSNIFMAFLVALVAGAMGFWVYRFLMYKIPVTILVKQGSSIVKANDRGRIIKKDNKDYFKLQKRKSAIIKIPDPTDFIMSERGPASLILLKYGQNDYTFVKPKFVKGMIVKKGDKKEINYSPKLGFVARDPADFTWYIDRLTENRKLFQFQDVLAKYGHIIIPLIGIALLMGFIIISYDYIFGGLNTALGQIGTLREGLEEVAKSLASAQRLTPAG